HTNIGFKTPENYFDTITTKLIQKSSHINNKEGFKVPNDYFTTVEDSILNQKSDKKSIVKVLSLNYRILYKIIPIGIAASFLIFMSLHYFTSIDRSFNKLTNTEMNSWLDENIDIVNEYSLLDTFDDVDIDELAHFNDNELINYIENNAIDESQLY
ncbi:MAG: hypothetical protein V3U80_05885, partial [Flavobacteriaceae bacterium]